MLESPRGALLHKKILMAETLGSLCDKLTIVKLKQWHTDEPARQHSLARQQAQLQQEMDEFVAAAAAGAIPAERLTFAANKVYKKEGNTVPETRGSLAEVFSKLAEVNCRLWHEVEKGYDIEQVPPDQKDGLIKQLAVLNLERTQCIDEIDRQFARLVRSA
jgi:hypothetical protein